MLAAQKREAARLGRLGLDSEKFTVCSVGLDQFDDPRQIPPPDEAAYRHTSG
jgi:hypothetical protein